MKNTLCDKAILKDKKVVLVNTSTKEGILEWARWFEDPKNRRVAHTIVGDQSVSTVFLAINHSWGNGPELWFETMIFGGPRDQEMDRYTTWEESEAGHKRLVEELKNHPPDPSLT